VKPDPSMQSLVTDLVTTWWTPVFLVLFVAVMAYALWPRNRATFDKAARLPLQDD
jgi:cytochrome c oxidase cbb3-type subunit 4